MYVENLLGRTKSPMITTTALKLMKLNSVQSLKTVTVKEKKNIYIFRNLICLPLYRKTFPSSFYIEAL